VPVAAAGAPVVLSGAAVVVSPSSGFAVVDATGVDDHTRVASMLQPVLQHISLASSSCVHRRIDAAAHAASASANVASFGKQSPSSSVLEHVSSSQQRTAATSEFEVASHSNVFPSE
jgi:hypothetical protein